VNVVDPGLDVVARLAGARDESDAGRGSGLEKPSARKHPEVFHPTLDAIGTG
jgi:hypothetical protein